MPLSFVLSHLQLKGGCSPTGDGGQGAVTGSWYNNVFTTLLCFASGLFNLYA